jgi:hypothetical protein
LQILGCRFQVADFRLQISGYRFQVADFRLQISDGRFQMADFRWQKTKFVDMKKDWRINNMNLNAQ